MSNPDTSPLGSRAGDVTNDQILAAACNEILNRDLMAGVQAAVAQRLGLSASTILRRFDQLDGGFERALIDWVLVVDVDGQSHKEAVADEIAGILEDATDPTTTLASIAYAAFEQPSHDERSRLRLLLQSRAASHSSLRARLKRDYIRRDRFERISWQDILTYLRTTTSSHGIQRSGLTEAELIVVLEALGEGLHQRATADPEVVTNKLYSQALLALVASVVDHDGDLRSIAEYLKHKLAHTIDLTDSAPAQSPNRTSARQLA